MAVTHMKRCSNLLIIREMQLKLHQNTRWQKSMTTHSTGEAVAKQALSYVASGNANRYNLSEGKFGNS